MCSNQIPPKDYACGGLIEPNDLSKSNYITHRRAYVTQNIFKHTDFLFEAKVYHTRDQEIENRICIKNSHQN